MKVETIKASSMADALKEVKSRLGSDAVIINTRTLTERRMLGLRKRQVVEVTAGKGVNVPKRIPPRARVPMQAVNAYVENGAKPVGPNPKQSSKPGHALLESPAVQNVTMLNFANEIDGLKAMVNSLVTEVRSRGMPSVPEQLFDHYNKLIQSEVAEELATDMLRKVQMQAKPEQLNNPVWVRERIVEQIEKLVPVSGPIQRTKLEGAHVVALIGPTGVGKTTTLAKIAANLKLREKKKVGLITLDTYRIAAVDQLRRYADLIGIQLEVVQLPEEITRAIEALGNVDYVLIDTAGRSPNDTLKLNELARYLELAKTDEVHLVLSSTLGTKAAELAIERFGKLRVDKVIFTKIDEAAQLGAMLGAVRKINKGLSYITTGQDVPDDIEVGQARRIARMIVGEH